VIIDSGGKVITSRGSVRFDDHDPESVIMIPESLITFEQNQI